ncbi:hypothetical protein LWC34_52715 [Kibdelosporangium philippinense]|uniref:Uncharacterized protein n=1 Tax=Kibdelosporangium philippinense TaxID=211113 RepID=A0ABS8ZUJ9_9PSEU|nr:hypothetical protein [Kibdelosporangium philippinense]MCE7011420.1 hypothetical protein [Kibdelosporangium philippinense]
MAGVEDIKAGIALANEKSQAGIAAITQASMQLDEARNALLSATQGSSQSDVSQAQGLLTEALQVLAGAQGAIQASISSAEGYANRL